MPTGDERHYGRRGFLLLVGGGLSSLVWAGQVSRLFSPLTSAASQLVGNLVPVGGWRIYTISGTMPIFNPSTWRLEIDGLVKRPRTFDYRQLRTLPKAEQVSTFHCVTGWTVENVHWGGVRFQSLFDLVQPLPSATAVRFVSLERPYEDSLTLEQPRFSRTERTLHWVHASAFLVLLASGLCLYLPSLAELIGRRPLLKDIHVYTALAWLAALALVLLAGDRRRLLATAREIDTFDADDRAWLRGRRTPQGRLNAGQKLNAIVTAALAVLFAVTGFFLWYGERNHAFRLQNALIVHDWLMYISFFLLLGHLYLSLVHPSTRHSLSAITRGWVRQDWALRHHPRSEERRVGKEWTSRR